MKIATTGILTASAIGVLLFSPTVMALPVITDGAIEGKKKGISFTSNHVALSEDELKALDNMLTKFELENSQRLDEEWGWFKKAVGYVVKKVTTCGTISWFSNGEQKWCRKRALKGNAHEEIVLTKEQAAEFEQFMDGAAEATISQDREDPVLLDERMVAVVDTKMSPVYEDSSSALTADPEMSDCLMEITEYMDGVTKKANEKPVSTFTGLPMTKGETDAIVNMLESFQRENALLKENEEFLSVFRFVANAIIRHVSGYEGAVGTEKARTFEVQLTAEQAEEIEAYFDNLGSKFIEEDRAAITKQNLRGGAEADEEIFGALIGAAGFALSRFLGDEE